MKVLLVEHTKRTLPPAEVMWHGIQVINASFHCTRFQALIGGITRTGTLDFFITNLITGPMEVPLIKPLLVPITTKISAVASENMLKRPHLQLITHKARKPY